MTKFTWIKEEVPSNLIVKQVYGIVFSNDKRIILQFDDNKYNLTGGKPLIEETYEETLKREYIEELNIEVDDLCYLGYLLVEEENIKPYAQVRLIGKIKNIYEKRPDIDNGKQYERFLSNLGNVKKYLNYDGDAGNIMIDDAINLADSKYEFDVINSIENFI